MGRFRSVGRTLKHFVIVYGVVGSVVLAFLCLGWIMPKRELSPAPPEAGQQQEEVAAAAEDEAGSRGKLGWAKGPGNHLSMAERVKQVEQMMKGQGYSSIPLDRLSAGYLTAQVTVQGKQLRLILDTGAPVTCLDPERTQGLNLEWKKIANDVQDKPFASWDTNQAAEVDALDIAGFKTGRLLVCIHRMTASNSILEQYRDPPCDGVLGGDILTAYAARIDYSVLRLFLRSEE
jgi:hypothetical protein